MSRTHPFVPSCPARFEHVLPRANEDAHVEQIADLLVVEHEEAVDEHEAVPQASARTRASRSASVSVAVIGRELQLLKTLLPVLHARFVDRHLRQQTQVLVAALCVVQTVAPCAVALDALQVPAQPRPLDGGCWCVPVLDAVDGMQRDVLFWL